MCNTHLGKQVASAGMVRKLVNMGEGRDGRAVMGQETRACLSQRHLPLERLATS